jgi:glycine cleavage system H protein
MSKKYTKDHEWIEAAGDVWRVGITAYAQEQLGDVVAVELPEAGRALAAGEECAVIESVKAASDIYSPAAGEVCAVNEALADNPALVNEAAEGDGWLWEMRLNNPQDVAELMDEAAYQTFVEEAQ